MVSSDFPRYAATSSLVVATMVEIFQVPVRGSLDLSSMVAGYSVVMVANQGSLAVRMATTKAVDDVEANVREEGLVDTRDVVL